MLTRGLSFCHDVIAGVQLYVLLALQNVVNNARLLVVVINPIRALLGNFLVRADQLLISKGPLKRVCPHFLPSEVVSEPVIYLCILSA